MDNQRYNVEKTKIWALVFIAALLFLGGLCSSAQDLAEASFGQQLKYDIDQEKKTKVIKVNGHVKFKAIIVKINDTTHAYRITHNHISMQITRHDIKEILNGIKYLNRNIPNDYYLHDESDLFICRANYFNKRGKYKKSKYFLIPSYKFSGYYYTIKSIKAFKINLQTVGRTLLDLDYGITKL